jgi:hypothetical protein
MRLPNTISASQSDLIDKARKKWMDRLVDVSRHNNLLYFRDLKTGTLDLSEADPAVMESFLTGQKVSLHELVPDLLATELRDRASAVFKRAQLNQEEKGLQTLHVAFGRATWPAEDKGRAAQAAVLLLPALIEVTGVTPTIQRQGDPQINLALLHVLESDFRITVKPDALLAGLLDDHPETDDARSYTSDVDEVIARISRAGSTIEGWIVTPAAVLCNFSFQKMAMLRDIRDYPEQIATHPILSAIAGDADARSALQRDRRDVQLRELDRMPAKNDYFVLEADSSQQRVIASVARLQDGVIQGPPGTGKSQTIVNLIATLIAQGRRVLFVAEKRAALEVVYERLRLLGLDHMVLDLHGADVSSKVVYERIAAALVDMRDVPPVDANQVNNTYEDRRDKLNRHVERLHLTHQPLNKSVYELQGLILRLPTKAHTSVRWRGQRDDQQPGRCAKSP